MTHRWIALPIGAVLAVGAVLGVQVANGGGTFEPLRAADPCIERAVTSQSSGIEALTEELVLIGMDEAACRLDVSREALILQIGQGGLTSAEQEEALRAGLLAAVDRMKRDGTLPPASDLADEALENANLNSIVKRLIRAVPDGVIDAALKTDGVLGRAIGDLDLADLVGDLTDPASLERQIQDAVEDAVKDSLLDRLRNLV